MSTKFTKTEVKLDSHGNVIGSETKDVAAQNIPADSRAESLIRRIQDSLRVAATLLNDARVRQQAAVEEALAGNFTVAVNRARTAGILIAAAKLHERDASLLLVDLIDAMRAEGFAEAIIFGVVETLIAEFLGA